MSQNHSRSSTADKKLKAASYHSHPCNEIERSETTLRSSFAVFLRLPDKDWLMYLNQSQLGRRLDNLLRLSRSLKPDPILCLLKSRQSVVLHPATVLALLEHYTSKKETAGSYDHVRLIAGVLFHDRLLFLNTDSPGDAK